VIASAIIAAIGHRSAFRKGRGFAAWLGLLPKQLRTRSVSPPILSSLPGSLPLQSSLMSKTYLKSDHFNGGGSQQACENHLGGTPSGQPIRTRFYYTGRLTSYHTSPRKLPRFVRRKLSCPT
jgi:hypothetical protein